MSDDESRTSGSQDNLDDEHMRVADETAKAETNIANTIAKLVASLTPTEKTLLEKRLAQMNAPETEAARAERERGERTSNAPVVSESQVIYPSAVNPPTVGTHLEVEAEADRMRRVGNAPVVTRSGTHVANMNAKSVPDSGIPFPFDPVAVEPGDVGQLFTTAPDTAKIRGVHISPDKGAEPTRLIAGRFNKEWEHLDDEDADPGIDVGPGMSIIVLVKNVSDRALLIGGNVFLHGEGLVPPVKVPDLALAQKAFEEAVSPVPQRQLAAASPAPIPVMQTAAGTLVAAGRTVSPGANEIAVCMTKNDARLLTEAIRTGMPIPDQNKWGILRRLDDALRG